MGIRHVPDILPQSRVALRGGRGIALPVWRRLEIPARDRLTCQDWVYSKEVPLAGFLQPAECVATLNDDGAA